MSAGLAVPARSATSDIVCHSHSLISRWELVFPSILPCLVALDVIGMVSAASREEMVFPAKITRQIQRMNDLRYGAHYSFYFLLLSGDAGNTFFINKFIVLSNNTANIKINMIRLT